MAGALLIPIVAILGPRVRDYFAVGVSFATALIALSLLPLGLSGRAIDIQVDWIPSLGLKAGVLVDPLSVLLANVVAWISLLIMIYSLGYMKHDLGLTRYWFLMNFFIGSMLLLVMSDNLLQLFFGWEGVGLCSYALIGHYYRDNKDQWVGTLGHESLGTAMTYPPSHAGMKAFITTRIGDISLMIAVFLIFSYAGTFNYLELTRNSDWMQPLAKAGLLVPVAVLFFGGPVGKSAQFPLHEWLPDAMAGPTPVSALIHAATMVKAGVFLIARGGPMFVSGIAKFAELTAFFEVVAWIGAFTAFMAATQALVAKEVKKTMAYSTGSQIGYMMLALGAGGLAGQFAAGYAAGLFHLVNHAIFKAAMFMAAGAIIHACGTRFMTEMGGLASRMKVTFIAMLILALSLSGVPPLSGFWSKEEILSVTLASGSIWLFLLASFTAAITILYSIRMVGLMFLGTTNTHLKGREQSEHGIQEAPKIMLIPYIVLAVATVAIGLVGPLFWENFRYFLTSSMEHSASVLKVSGHDFAVGPTVMATSLLMLALGGSFGYVFYVSGKVRGRSVIRHPLTRSLYSFLWNRWYINPIYYRIFSSGILSVCRAIWRNIEVRFFDRISNAVAYFSLSTSTTSDRVDLRVIDRVVNEVASFGKKASGFLRLIQTGFAQQYLFAFSLGVILLVLLLAVSLGV